MTEFDEIKGMSVEELAEFLLSYDSEWDVIETSDLKGFTKKSEAIDHEIEWLLSCTDDEKEKKRFCKNCKHYFDYCNEAKPICTMFLVGYDTAYIPEPYDYCSKWEQSK